MSEEMLPCPFCGCDKVVVYYDHPESVGPVVGGGYYISHPLWKEYPKTWGCNVQWPGYFDSEAAAAQAWNGRVSPSKAPTKDKAE